MIHKDTNLPQADGMEDETNIEKTTKSENGDNETKEEENADKPHDYEEEIPTKNYATLSPESLISEVEYLVSHFSVNKISRNINNIRNAFEDKIKEDQKQKKEKFIEDGGQEEHFSYENPLVYKFRQNYSEYKKQLKVFYQNVEDQQKQNLEKRQQLIEDLKSLYQDPQESTSELFKEFRRIKKEWHDAGRVPNMQSADVFRNYYHHLDNFYEYLNLNKELQDLDYAHNLETRQSILSRTEKLLVEPNIQKAVNELQYLHKLWKEEAVPVAEEHREPTWNRFKELTQKIHDRKQELYADRKKVEEENANRKQSIIDEIHKINERVEDNHKFYQTELKSVEALRKEFMEIGRAPKALNNKLWNDFKNETKNFNKSKNNFYKKLKSEQSTNLDEKQALVQLAKDNHLREDWDEAVKLFKKIQSDWKNVGVVPRKFSQPLWKEFNQYCNIFFDNFKNRNKISDEVLNTNLEKKEEILNSLKKENWKDLSQDEVTDKSLKINSEWQNTGPISKENEGINKDFMSALQGKIKESGNDISVSNLQSKMKANRIKQSGDSNKQNEELRKIKSQIQELKVEMTHLENNLSFFSNADENNPLLKNVHNELDQKRSKIEKLQQEYDNIRRIKFEDNAPENPGDEDIPNNDSSEE